MKDLRNPARWTNKEIEADSTGFVAAQQAFREDQERERAEQAERRDREHFGREFVASGGTRSGAEAAYRERRDERAAEAARAADEAARGVQRGAVFGRL